MTTTEAHEIVLAEAHVAAGPADTSPVRSDDGR